MFLCCRATVEIVRSWRTSPNQPWQASSHTTQPGFANSGQYPAAPYAPQHQPYAVPHPGFMPPTEPVFGQPPPMHPAAQYYYNSSPPGRARPDANTAVDPSRMHEPGYSTVQ